MESRTERYQEFDIEEFQRSKKNANLYKEVYGNYGDFEDLPVSENTNEIDIENLKSLVGSRTSRKKEEFNNREINIEEETIVMPKEEKVYDINELLENAKKENAKIKKENPVNRNIPNYLANLESDKNTKEIILKYDGDNDDDLPIIKEIKYSTSEIHFDGDKVNTSTLSLDILSDLKPNGNTQVSEPITDELLEENLKEEKDFFDNKVNFSKDDFDDNDEDDDELFYEEKEHVFLKVFLILIGISAIGVAAFFLLKEYTNLF